MNSPAPILQDCLSEPVPIPCRTRGVIGGSIALDPKCVTAGIGGVDDREVDEAASRADLMHYIMPKHRERSPNLLLEIGVWLTTGHFTDAQDPRLRVTQERLEDPDPFGLSPRKIDRVGSDGRKNLHALTSSRDQDIEPPLPVIARERAEAHRHIAACVRPVPDREKNDVPLVTLNGLEVLYEERLCAPLEEELLDVWAPSSPQLDLVEDRVTLCHRKGSDPQGPVRIFRSVSHHRISYFTGLGSVGPRPAPIVNGIRNMMECDAEMITGDGARDDEQLVVVKSPI